MSLWDACISSLLRAYRLLRIDTRGHGASDAPDGDYALSLLAADVAICMDAAGAPRAAIAGVSLGGMIGMQLALDQPRRVSALALICTSASIDTAAWDGRIRTVREHGTNAIAEMAVGRLLSPRFVARHAEIAADLRRAIAAQSAAGYAGAGAAIRDSSLAGRIADIAVPTLVVTGTLDISTPFAGHGDALVASIPRARHVALTSAHLPPVEAPGPLAAALLHFIDADPGVDQAAQIVFEAGLRNRRRVLGAPWVDRSLAGRTSFNAEFQAMITRIAWYEIWGRPGLDDRTRRLLTVAITASLGCWEEFGLHVRTGLANGDLSQDELKEVLMQTAIYAGVPAANTGFAEATRIIVDLDTNAA